MKESKLIDYFRGDISAEELRDQLSSSVSFGDGTMVSKIEYERDLKEEELSKEHIEMICRDFLIGTFSPEDIKILSFSAIASDCLCWDSDTLDGEFVAECFYSWSSPETDGSITVDLMKRIKTECEQDGPHNSGQRSAPTSM